MDKIIVTFKNLIEELANTNVPKNVFNQYSYKAKENALRRENLLIYFQQMYKLKPKVILIAEAPGYRGNRITGVPFTSEYILMNNIRGLDLFGEEKGYKLPTKEARLSKEATATIIWDALLENNTVALGWNAFPFHPYKADNDKSNRTPTKEELIIGEPFILRIVDIFNIEEIVAVGNKAKESLDRLGIHSKKVRHPAQGGKNKFLEGLKLIKEGNNLR